MEQTIIVEKYGAVYTPHTLADFVSHLLIRCVRLCHSNIHSVIDPACGEGSLLQAINAYLPKQQTIGIDIDESVSHSIPCFVHFEVADFILPHDTCFQLSADYWRDKYPDIDAIIANPPWSSNRIYDKETLHKRGFFLANGQYDSYELFIELGISILQENGFYAFIIPDSLFAPEKLSLRKWLLENTELKIVARLGEKIFPGVFRATTVIVGRKTNPKPNCKTICYRLDTISRDAFLHKSLELYTHFLRNNHSVPQKRFLSNPSFNIDVDSTIEDSIITQTMSEGNLKMRDLFDFGRGVEISKKGFVVTCPKCGNSQGIRNITKKHATFTCHFCHKIHPLKQNSVMQIVKNIPGSGYCKMWVGESIARYHLSKPRFIMNGVDGIDYKTTDLFSGPKLLIRKTGLGIYASIDTTDTLTSQTVYILKIQDNTSIDILYFYLAFINSRIMFFYYQKIYGTAEWKSHPYLTKQVIFSLPIPRYDKESLQDSEIVKYSKSLSASYQREIDLRLETLIAKRYGIKECQLLTVKKLMSGMPELSSINDMRF